MAVLLGCPVFHVMSTKQAERGVGKGAAVQKALNCFIFFHHLVKAQLWVWYEAEEVTPPHGISLWCCLGWEPGFGSVQGALADGLRTEDELQYQRRAQGLNLHHRDRKMAAVADTHQWGDIHVCTCAHPASSTKPKGAAQHQQGAEPH